MRFLWIFLLLCGVYPVNAAEIKFGEKAVFNVPVARSVDELTRGLMFVQKLPDDGGMLFDFRPYLDRDLSMWMKNTYIPLDMVFLDCDFVVVDIYKNAKPKSLELIKSKKKYCYVLEINGGAADSKNINIGDKVLYSDIK